VVHCSINDARNRGNAVVSSTESERCSTHNTKPKTSQQQALSIVLSHEEREIVSLYHKFSTGIAGDLIAFGFACHTPQLIQTVPIHVVRRFHLVMNESNSLDD
jgi:hypothetical protein